ncbi:MAG: YraN family protein [Planctomycetaceae bacterium]|jgi:putative endonuclease|nr:YraN family protein [Planctomycetaceae bacterium]
MSIHQQVRDWWHARRKPKPLGVRGEAAAARFLKQKGYVIVGRSERDRIGGIDLVAVDGRTVVFVEVKTRRHHDAGRPVEAVDSDKQRRITRTSLSYLRRHDLLENAARLDIVAVTWPDGQRMPTIEHCRDAFEPTDTGQMFS